MWILGGSKSRASTHTWRNSVGCAVLAARASADAPPCGRRDRTPWPALDPFTPRAVPCKPPHVSRVWNEALKLPTRPSTVFVRLLASLCSPRFPLLLPSTACPPRSDEEAFKQSVESITGPISRTISTKGMPAVYEALDAEGKKIFEQVGGWGPVRVLAPSSWRA